MITHLRENPSAEPPQAVGPESGENAPSSMNEGLDFDGDLPVSREQIPSGAGIGHSNLMKDEEPDSPADTTPKKQDTVQFANSSSSSEFPRTSLTSSKTKTSSSSGRGSRQKKFRRHIGTVPFEILVALTANMRVPAAVKRYLTFYRLHVLYILGLVFVGTILLYFSPGGKLGPISFIDALFVATSASCVCGLCTIRMKELSDWGQVVILVLVMLGSHVFTSLLPVLVRRYYFHLYLYKTRETPNDPSHMSRLGTSSAEPLNSIKEEESHDVYVPMDDSFHGQILSFAQLSDELSRDKNFRQQAMAEDVERASLTWSGDNAKVEARRIKLALEKFRDRARMETPPSLGVSSGGSTRGPSANVAFLDSDDGGTDQDGYVDSRRLRTLEYRALQTLSWLVPTYFFGIQFVSFILLRLTFLSAPHERRVLRDRQVSQWFMSVFQSVAAFNNAGFSLVDESIVPFQRDTAFLTILGVLVLVGNTMYAPTMRCIIYMLYRLSPRGHRSVYRYLLDHPRKCFTHLFPRDQTIWLALFVLIINSTEIVFFCALDWNSAALEGLSGGYKFLDGIFQSLNTRSAGMTVIAVSLLTPAMLVLYCGMMYIAVYPVYLSRQVSQAQQEIYDDTDVGVFNKWEPVDTGLLTQSRKLLARDSAFLFIAIFIICIVQKDNLEKDPSFSIFNVIFECISAYGTVGMSLGYTCTPPPGGTCESPPYSFSGVWAPGGKFILVLLMLLGRHRGLPTNIDSAIVIPSRKNFKSGPRRIVSAETRELYAYFGNKISSPRGASGATLWKRLRSKSGKMETLVTGSNNEQLQKSRSLPNLF